MKYLAFALRIMIMTIGLVMIIMFPNPATPPFMSGVAFLTIGLYLTLMGCYGTEFTNSVFKKEVPVRKKKIGSFFSNKN